MIKDEKRYNLAADNICDKILQSKAHGANHIVSSGHLSNLNSAQMGREEIWARADDRRSLLFVKINFVMTR